MAESSPVKAGKRLQAEKLQAVGRLASGIAHEINTPTQYVSDNTAFLSESFGDLQALLEQVRELPDRLRSGDSEEVLAGLQKTIDEADVDYLIEEIPRALEQSKEGLARIKKIVRSMKEFAHPGSDDKAPTDLNKAIESTLTVARNEWKYVAELETDFDERVVAVPCYSDAFNQVVLNMVINATHAIRDVIGEDGDRKGHIKITTRMLDGWAEVRIADDGAGIPEEARPKIFEPFYTTKGVGVGSGQGLAIAHQVVCEQHGGELDFETALGQGTTFIIRLPLEPTSK